MDVKSKQDLLGRIARHLILSVNAVENIGLLNGRMGIAIFFYHYSRYTGNSLYSEFAGELIDDMYEDINTDTPFNFEDGFCGIGWGILHLIEEKFLDAEADEVLSEMDVYIMEKDVRKIKDVALYNGLAGIAHYVVQRKNMDRTYLEELIDNMDSKEFIDEEFGVLKTCLKDMIDQKNKAMCFTTGALLQSLVENNLVEVDNVFISNRKLGINKNGLSGIGLHLMLNEHGKY